MVERGWRYDNAERLRGEWVNPIRYRADSNESRRAIGSSTSEDFFEEPLHRHLVFPVRALLGWI